jgi:hypothetical protein
MEGELTCDLIFLPPKIDRPTKVPNNTNKHLLRGV